MALTMSAIKIVITFNYPLCGGTSYISLLMLTALQQPCTVIMDYGPIEFFRDLLTFV